MIKRKSERCLLVVAHPQKSSLCHHLAERTLAHLQQRGYQVTVKDLYQENFDPRLSIPERDSYYQGQFYTLQVQEDIEQLKQTDVLVLVFPTWWFGFPAILKGWFDRIWAPGHAYAHASDFGPIKPMLNKLKDVKIVTTLGSPWWVDYFIMRRPVKRVLKTALVGTCSRHCRFTMLSLYSSERLNTRKINKFINKIKQKF